MKKILLLLAALSAGLSVNAETLYELTFDYQKNQTKTSSYTEPWQVVCDNFTWDIANFNNNNNGGGSKNSQGGANVWEFVRCGSKKAASTATIINADAMTGSINQIVLNLKKNKKGTNDKVTTAKIEVLASKTATTALATYTITDDVNALTTKTSDITVNIQNAADNLYYKITFDMPQNTNNGWLELHSVKYNGTSTGPILEDPEITFPQSSYDVKLGEPFDAPVATAKSDGTITYTSSDESVATVDAETGAVEILAAGTTTITAKIAATQTYSSGNAQYTISVTDPTVIFKWAKGGEEVFTFEQVSGTVQPWSYDSRYGLKGSAYENGINACEAIAASPVIDLEGKKEITLNFRNAFNNYKVNNNMIDVADFPGKYAFIMVKEEGANDWTELCEPTAPAEFSWNFYDNDVISLDAYKDKRIQFGFKYVSTEDCAGTWEVDNIIVNGKVAVGVANIEAEENVAPVYYNLQGVRVANPQNGLYIQVKGGKSSKVLVK